MIRMLITSVLMICTAGCTESLDNDEASKLKTEAIHKKPGADLSQILEGSGGHISPGFQGFDHIHQLVTISGVGAKCGIEDDSAQYYTGK